MPLMPVAANVRLTGPPWPTFSITYTAAVRPVTLGPAEEDPHRGLGYGARHDEDFSNDARWRTGRDDAGCVDGRLQQHSVVIDGEVGIGHLGYHNRDHH